MEVTSHRIISRTERFQKFDAAKTRIRSDHDFIDAQQEALRKATLLKHRKVSTQLKLDVAQRQLNELRFSVRESDTDHKFYSHQVDELSGELQDLGVTLEQAEKKLYHVRRRVLRNSGLEGFSALPLSSSHPAIYSSNEGLDRRSASTRNNFKSRMSHLMSSPPKMRKRLLFGELRAVASLSSLNTKSSSHPAYDDATVSKDTKPWKRPLRFLGNLMDNQFRRRFWNTTKRTKSSDHVLSDGKFSNFKDFNDFPSPKPNITIDYPSSSSCENSDDEDETTDLNWKKSDESNEFPNVEKENEKCITEQKDKIDPDLLAEIDDFEKMAARYINLCSRQSPS